MQTISIHKSLPNFSRIIYGAWRLNDDKDTSTQHIQNKISACLEQGITSFDHADIYGNYECERLFGNGFKQFKDKCQHISKCDIMLATDKFPNRRVKYYDTSRGHIMLSVENSLKLLGIDALDILLIHRPDPLMNADETGLALDDLIQQGKIKSAGVSNFSPAEFDLLQSRMKNPLVTNQIEQSVLCLDSFRDGSLAHLYRHKIKPLAWSPLAGGRLFHKENQHVLTLLNKIGAEFGVVGSAVAVQFLLHHPAEILPIVGTNDLGRIKKISDALKVSLTREQWFEIYSCAQGHEVP